MERIKNFSSHFIVFRPTGKIVSIKEIRETHDEFFHGELTEEFANYCANQAIHAFWINYNISGKKIRKEAFCEKFKEIVNHMLKEM